MNNEMHCKICGKHPSEIDEYVEIADGKEITESFMTHEEGTYNPTTKLFYCTHCYIAIGMPLGTA